MTEAQNGLWQFKCVINIQIKRFAEGVFQQEEEKPEFKGSPGCKTFGTPIQSERIYPKEAYGSFYGYKMKM